MIKESFFYSSIKKYNTKFLLFNIVFTLMLLVISNIFSTDFFNVIFGPFELDTDDLLIIPEVTSKVDYSLNPYLYSMMEEHPLDYNYYKFNNKYYFRVKSTESYDSGVAYQKSYQVQSDGLKINSPNYITHKYVLMRIEDKYLVAKVSLDQLSKTYDGILVPLFPKLKREIINQSNGFLSKYDFFPFMLNGTGKHKAGVYFKLVVCILLLLINLYNYVIIMLRFKDLHRHPVYQHIGRYGDKKEVIESIDREVIQNYEVNVKDKIIITDQWIIKRGFVKLNIRKNHLKKERYY